MITSPASIVVLWIMFPASEHCMGENTFHPHLRLSTQRAVRLSPAAPPHITVKPSHCQRSLSGASRARSSRSVVHTAIEARRAILASSLRVSTIRTITSHSLPRAPHLTSLASHVTATSLAPLSFPQLNTTNPGPPRQKGEHPTRSKRETNRRRASACESAICTLAHCYSDENRVQGREQDYLTRTSVNAARMMQLRNFRWESGRHIPI